MKNIEIAEIIRNAAEMIEENRKFNGIDFDENRINDCGNFIENFTLDCDIIGIRSCDSIHTIGELLDVSHVWDDGTPTDESLPGTSALGGESFLRELEGNPEKEFTQIYGKKLYLVCGSRDHYEYSTDKNEMVIENCVVLMELK